MESCGEKSFIHQDIGCSCIKNMAKNPKGITMQKILLQLGYFFR